MSARSAPLCRRALLQYVVYTASGVAICCAPPNSAAAAPKISKKAVAYQDHPDGKKRCEKMRAIPASGRLQDGRGSNQPGGFVSDIRADPAIMSQTRLWNKPDT
jgi:hypothetical protein